MRKILTLIFICTLVSTILSGCFGDTVMDETEPTTVESPAITDVPPTTTAPELTWPKVEGMLEDILTSEPNTSERVDEIAKLAKAFAEDDTDSAHRTAEAVNYIRAMHNDLFRSNEIMEHAMFLGCYLDYLYSDDMIQSELGYDTFRAIKYVYRGAETIEDAAYALEHISEDLAAIDER